MNTSTASTPAASTRFVSELPKALRDLANYETLAMASHLHRLAREAENDDVTMFCVIADAYVEDAQSDSHPEYTKPYVYVRRLAFLAGLYKVCNGARQGKGTVGQYLVSVCRGQVSAAKAYEGVQG